MSALDERYSLEKSYAVYDNKEGVSLKVGPDRDVGEYVEIFTNDKASADFFGETRIVLPPTMAKMLGMALVQAADDALNGKNK